MKIFHCADLHLGLQFTKYPEELAQELREARFTTLEKMVNLANEARCDLFVVAGDLFDHLKVSQRYLARAAKILAGFDRVAVVLPGNHDFYSGASDDFWKHFPLPEHGRVLLLDQYRPYPLQDLGVNATLYPSHCNKKKSEKQNALGWLEQCERAPGFFQIGIAHGSFEGLSPDLEKDYFPMNAAELEKFRMDLWLMGHIHVQFPPKPSPQSRIFYSGTHEPDGMDCKHEGKAWLIELQEDRSVKASSISTGSFRFHEEEVEIRSRSELESLGTRLSLAKNMIVRLKVRGALPRADFEGVAGVIEEIRSRVFFLHSDLSQLSIALTPEEIGNEFPEGGFAYRLLTELSTREKDRAALQLAYEMIQGGER